MKEQIRIDTPDAIPVIIGLDMPEDPEVAQILRDSLARSGQIFADQKVWIKEGQWTAYIHAVTPFMQKMVDAFKGKSLEEIRKDPGFLFRGMAKLQTAIFDASDPFTPPELQGLQRATGALMREYFEVATTEELNEFTILESVVHLSKATNAMLRAKGYGNY